MTIIVAGPEIATVGSAARSLAFEVWHSRRPPVFGVLHFCFGNQYHVYPTHLQLQNNPFGR
jgi:hypothetical protein